MSLETAKYKKKKKPAQRVNVDENVKGIQIKITSKKLKFQSKMIHIITAQILNRD